MTEEKQKFASEIIRGEIEGLNLGGIAIFGDFRLWEVLEAEGFTDKEIDEIEQNIDYYC